MVASVFFVFRKAFDLELILFDNYLPYMFPFAEFFCLLPFTERKGIQFHCHCNSFLPKNGMGLMEQKSGIHAAGKSDCHRSQLFQTESQVLLLLQQFIFHGSLLSLSYSDKLYHSSKQALYEIFPFLLQKAFLTFVCACSHIAV